MMKLNTTTSTSVILNLKPVLARFGISLVMVTDNGPQFVSKEMAEFLEAFGFRHVTTSP